MGDRLKFKVFKTHQLIPKTYFRPLCIVKKGREVIFHSTSASHGASISKNMTSDLWQWLYIKSVWFHFHFFLLCRRRHCYNGHGHILQYLLLRNCWLVSVLLYCILRRYTGPTLEYMWWVWIQKIHLNVKYKYEIGFN